MKTRVKVYLSIIGIIICLLGIVMLIFHFKKIEVSNLFETSGESHKISQDSGNELTSKVIKIEGVKQVGDIEFSNIKINLVAKKKCEFLADIKNVSDQYVKSKNIKISVVNSSGETDEIFGGITTELAGYEPNKFKTIVLADITDATDVIIEISSEEEAKDE